MIYSFLFVASSNPECFHNRYDIEPSLESKIKIKILFFFLSLFRLQCSFETAQVYGVVKQNSP